MTSLQEVNAYLTNNTTLRDVLGAKDDVEWHVRPLGKGEHNENFMFSCADSQNMTQGKTNAKLKTSTTFDELSGTTTRLDGQRRYVLRVNVLPQPFHDNQIAYEFAALKTLEPSGRVPHALYMDDTPQAPGKGVLVESFCEGSELDFDHLRPGDLQCAAQLMADVHAVPVTDDCSLFRPKDPLQEIFDECVARYAVYRGTALEDPRFSRWIEQFFAATQNAMDAAPPFDGQGHIINTETLPSHFMIPDQPTTTPQAIRENPGTFLDWERPIVGEVAQDLGFFVAPSTTFWDSDYLFPREQIQGFVEDYWRAVDGRFERGSFDLRFEAYLRVSVLRSQTWFCKNAARYAPGSTGHTTQRTFEKWDTYVSDEFNEMLLRECFSS